MRILITGGCGFLGSHVVDHFLQQPDTSIVVLDRLSYASNGFDRLRDSQRFDDKRVLVLAADFTRPIVDGLAREIGQVDVILHLGAETHVDRSIADPRPFVLSNVVGTMELLELARRQRQLRRFIYLSTDEVYGPALPGVAYREWDRYNSCNPYAASKAGGEELCLAWANTYGVPVTVVRTMNIFGERQHAEKFIPTTLRHLLDGTHVPIHTDLNGKIGSRFWIHARNVAGAIDFLVEVGAVREKYNVVGELELNNLEMAKLVADAALIPLRYKRVHGGVSRPGHDARYALDGAKLAGMGWQPPIDFYTSLSKTVRWYLANPRWLRQETYTEVAV